MSANNTNSHHERRHQLPPSDVGRARSKVERLLARTSLPQTLKQRLLADVDGGSLYCRVESVNDITALPANASYCSVACGCCCRTVHLVNEGMLGRLVDEGEYFFLAPGYHSYSSCGTEMLSDVDVETINMAITNGPAGFVTITEGHIGVLLVSGEYRLLAPGTYCWQSAAVQLVQVAALGQDVVKLGPYHLVTVPNGDVGVSYNNGELRVLGLDAEVINIQPSAASATGVPTAVPLKEVSQGGDEDDDSASNNDGGRRRANPLLEHNTNSGGVINANGRIAAVGVEMPGQKEQTPKRRTYFLDDPCWLFCCFLSLRMRTDTLESNNLLSKDNVELIMVAMSQWRIVDPVLAVKRCGNSMSSIADKINALIRATIARVVAGTNIGAGPVSGSVAKEVVVATPIANNNDDSQAPAAKGAGGAHPDNKEASLAYLMQSAQAAKHMAELTLQAESMGVEVAGVYVPEKRMKNDDIRREVASQAVIGIKADAERSAADAKAYATIRAANAEAQAIEVLAKAHAEAGQRLGDPQSTASRLALTETTAKALHGSKITMFSGSMDKIPYAFTQAMQ